MVEDVGVHGLQFFRNSWLLFFPNSSALTVSPAATPYIERVRRVHVLMKVDSVCTRNGSQFLYIALLVNKKQNLATIVLGIPSESSWGVILLCVLLQSKVSHGLI